MSAFSNWNGPDCGHGPSLPQITTLETLWTEVNKFRGELVTLTTELRDHENDGYNSPAANLHKSLQYAISQIKQAVDDVYTQTVVDQKLSLKANVTDVYTKAVVDTALNLKADKSDTYTKAQVYTKLETDDKYALKTAFNQLKAAYDAFVANLNTGITVTDTTNILKALYTLQITCEYIEAAYYLDFTKWAKFTAPIYVVQNRNEQTFLLGVLSQDWRQDALKPGALTKGGRIFIKFDNTDTFDAIVDAVVTEHDPTGSLHALASKTATRTAYTRHYTTTGITDPTNPASTAPIDGLKEMPPIRFGLYKGTVNGKNYYYIGVVIKEGQLVTLTTNGGLVSGALFYAVGENILPLKSPERTSLFPNGAVTEIAGADLNNDESFIVSAITAEKFYSDNYLDSQGAGLAVVTRDPNTLEKQAFDIGDPEAPAPMYLHTSDRPLVYVNKAQHQMGFLEDLAQSAYFQREVAVVVEDAAELATCLVTVNANNEIITWDPNGNNVPGIYTNDKTTANPTGIIFKNGDIALIKSNGEYSPPLEDGKLNDTAPAAGTTKSVPLTSISGLNKDMMRPSENTNTAVAGTLLISTDGIVCVIYQLDVATPGNVIIQRYTGTIPVYTLPAYSELTSGAWSTAIELIPVPGTYDGYVHDVTYTWNGYHKDSSGLDEYVNTTVYWTAHYENDTTMDWPGNGGLPAAWSFNDLLLSGMRNQKQQDYIDDYLQELGEMQPDWMEEDATMLFQRPEQAEKVIPNPAFIQHRPWTGVALADAGSIMQNNFWYPGWMLDAGDFRNSAGQLSSIGRPIIPANQAFKNVVMKQVFGLYGNQPEIVNPIQSVWDTFDRTFRILWDGTPDSDTELWISAGNSKNELVRFISANMLGAEDAPTLIKGVEFSVPEVNEIKFAWAGVQLTRFHAEQISGEETLTSGTINNDAGEPQNIFEITDWVLTSPALTAEQEDRKTRDNELDERVTDIENALPISAFSAQTVEAALAAEATARADADLQEIDARNAAIADHNIDATSHGGVQATVTNFLAGAPTATAAAMIQATADAQTDADDALNQINNIDTTLTGLLHNGVIPAPTAAGQVLQWTGTAFAWVTLP